MKNNSLLIILLTLGIASAIQPTTLSLSSRKISKRSLASHRRALESYRKRDLSATTVPLLDNFRGTDLQQNFTVVFDTGSQDLELPGKNCTSSCANQHVFDWDKSSTFELLNSGPSGDGVSVTFTTGGDATPAGLQDLTMNLVQVADTISVGGLSVANVSFFMIQKAFSEDQYDGILGVFSSPGSFFQGLIDQGLPPLVSFYITPQSIGGAEVTLGGIDSSKFNSTMIFSPLVSGLGTGDWILNTTAISVNGKTSDVLAVTIPVIFDTGTTNVFLPQNMTEAVYALISPDILPNADEPGAFGIPCDKVDTLPAVIDFTFTSVAGDPFNLTLPSSELNLGSFKGNSSLCQTVFNSYGNLTGLPPTIGGSLFKHYYTTWNSGDLTLGFAALGNSSA
ncbi:acid protease [Mycena floridula]|nr:acid protease [Mycena floridula]